MKLVTCIFENHERTGDIVEAEVENLGQLKSRIVAE